MPGGGRMALRQVLYVKFLDYLFTYPFKNCIIKLVPK